MLDPHPISGVCVENSAPLAALERLGEALEDEVRFKREPSVCRLRCDRSVEYVR